MNCYRCKKEHFRNSELCVFCAKKDFSQKDKCRRKSRNLLKQGHIFRSNKCESPWCKNKFQNIEKLQMHHQDYSKPELIIWLCMSCHARYHASCGLLSLKGLNEKRN